MKKQTSKVGEDGSFINQLMANNSTEPVVGQGATQLHYTDRTCYEVVEVSEDKRTARLQRLDAKWDSSLPGGEGHQNWILEPVDNHFITVTWRKNGWYIVGHEVEFTKEFRKQCEDNGATSIPAYLRKTGNLELLNEVYGDHVMPINVVDGVTRKKKTYSKINIMFGVKDYYFHWEF